MAPELPTELCPCLDGTGRLKSFPSTLPRPPDVPCLTLLPPMGCIPPAVLTHRTLILLSSAPGPVVRNRVPGAPQLLATSEVLPGAGEKYLCAIRREGGSSSAAALGAHMKPWLCVTLRDVASVFPDRTLLKGDLTAISPPAFPISFPC